MARRGYENDATEESGDAAHDGYTCYAKRPRTAAPGIFLGEAEADAFDATTNMMARYGGRDSRLMRRMEDPSADVDPEETSDNA